MRRLCFGLTFIFYFLFSIFSLAFAQDVSSTSFIVADPILTMAGGFSSSTSFQAIIATGQLATDESTSTNFTARNGVLYFPTASSPILAATAGDAQVSLTWTASTGQLANVTDYQLGTATASGGPYTFESVGNVTSFTKTGLTNGTTYYFILKVFAGTLFILQSGETSGTPAVAPPATPTTPSGGGGGGGGGYIPPSAISVNFSGRAYPLSTVTLLKDAQIAIQTVAGPDANFKMSLTGLSGGSYLFSIYSSDKDGRRSGLISFPITLTTGATTNISGIFIAPTIDVDKSEIKRGESLAIFGQSAPDSNMVISVNSDNEYFLKTKTDKDGIYLKNFDTSLLTLGQHYTKSKTLSEEQISPFSAAVGFLVGHKTVKKNIQKCPAKADLNGDCRVNLIDFSIAAFWYKRVLSAEFSQKEKNQLNGDGKINLIDFSIMAYYWTG